MNHLIAKFSLLATTAIASPASPQSLADRLATVTAEFDLHGAIIVTKAGTPIFAAGYGMANRELGVQNTPDTKFRIGSVTKQFTAMGILILQERGLLNVDDAVAHHVSDLPTSWRTLTLHQLLTHTSGIMHSWALPGFRESMAAPTTLDETLAQYFDKPLLFEPGTGFTYSGVAYFLLAKVIENVSGQGYADFLTTEIFDPLDMNDTGADHPRAVLVGRASGYQQDPDGIVRNAPTIFMPVLTGGGNLYSTVRDLAKWDRALTENRLVSDRAYAAMYRPDRDNYAYGWVVGEFQGHDMLSHNGGVPGFAAANVRFPAAEVDIVILTNMTPVNWQDLPNALAAIMLTASDSTRGAP